MHYLADEFRAACSVINEPSIVHIGAHKGEEAEYYDSLRPKPKKVLWIEANRDLVDELSAHVSRFEGQSALWGLVANTTDDKRRFHIASNPQCSSLLELGEHRRVYPEVDFVGDHLLGSFTLDELLDIWREGHRDFWSMTPFNVMVLDVQGAEALVIDGAVRTLRNVRLICTEVNFAELYRGCLKIDEFDALMEKQGFARFATLNSGYDWGDALYRRIR